MNFGTKNDSKAKFKSIGKIRKAQLVTTFGPGSIAEMPEYTIILGATDYWDKPGKVFYEKNLQRLLGVKNFREPYASESDQTWGNPDIPAYRFPRMHFCPSCHKLDDYSSFGDPKKKKCIECNKEIVPSRFVAACVNGHLEDFPFEWWVHYGNPGGCTDPGNHHKLQMIFNNNTGGLSSIVIKCKACGKERSMEGCMSKNALMGYHCRGRRPWIGFSNETNDSEPCKAQMRTLQRGASNLYFSVTKSALTIPPWSNKINSVITDNEDDIRILFENDIDEAFLRKYIVKKFREYIDDGRYTVDDFYKEIMNRLGENTEEEDTLTEKQLYEDEYKALCEGYLPDNEEEPEEFQAEISDISDSLIDYFDEVVLVKRLREVLALRGFRRLTPTPPIEGDDSFPGANGSEFTPLWNKSRNWLPAIEMRGEGIFIRLNEERLKEWEETVGDRYDAMGKRLGNMDIGKGMFSPRYVLLHTLSHLLIRQLTIDCGYQEAALKERIYSTYPESSLEMAGILIYTSSSDSDGSLGGLVRQGEYDLLETTIRNLLQEASWCSSDPLCIESTSQGYNSLNYAACHACTLLPETSCEARNCLLDRVSVVGRPDRRELGFFGDFIGE